MTGWTLPTTTSGRASSRRMSPAAVMRSMARVCGLSLAFALAALALASYS